MCLIFPCLLELRSFPDTVAGLKSCVCHGSRQDSRSNWGCRTLGHTRKEARENFSTFPLPLLCLQCQQHHCYDFALVCKRLFDPWGNNCRALQTCGLRRSRSTKRKPSKDKTSSGSDAESNQTIHALQFLSTIHVEHNPQALTPGECMTSARFP